MSVTLSAMALTVPLCALHFGMVSLVGVLTNLLCLWAVTVLFYAIMAACMVGALLPAVGKTIAWAAAWLVRYILSIARTLASIPFSAVYTESIYVVIWLVLCYALLTVYFVLKVRHTKLMLGCAAVGLCAALLFSWLEPRLDEYRVTVLDVGEGQCILLQTQGKNYMVDCGGDNVVDAANLAAQTLLSQGIRQLDGVIVTHFDSDHAGGVTDLLSRIPAKRLYLPGMEDPGSIRKEIEKTARNICWISAEQTVAVEGGLITIFSGKEGTSDNESSLCVLFQPENCDILIMADRSVSGERKLLSQAQLPNLEVLLVGHHGAKTSTGVELLNATLPEIAVISVGAGNRYGHPAQQVLDRLERYGCQVLRTDQLGNIIIRG